MCVRTDIEISARLLIGKDKAEELIKRPSVNKRVSGISGLIIKKMETIPENKTGSIILPAVIATIPDLKNMRIYSIRFKKNIAKKVFGRILCGPSSILNDWYRSNL